MPVQAEADSETVLLCNSTGNLKDLQLSESVLVAITRRHTTVVRLTISLSEPEYRDVLRFNSIRN